MSNTTVEGHKDVDIDVGLKGVGVKVDSDIVDEKIIETKVTDIKRVEDKTITTNVTDEECIKNFGHTFEELQELISKAMNVVVDVQTEYENSIKEVSKVEVKSQTVSTNDLNTDGGIVVGKKGHELIVDQMNDANVTLKCYYYGNFLSECEESPEVKFMAASLLNLDENGKDMDIPDFNDPKTLLELVGVYDVVEALIDNENRFIKYKQKNSEETKDGHDASLSKDGLVHEKHAELKLDVTEEEQKIMSTPDEELLEEQLILKQSLLERQKQYDKELAAANVAKEEGWKVYMFDDLFWTLSKELTINFTKKVTDINKHIENIQDNINASTSLYQLNVIKIAGNVEDVHLTQSNKAIQELILDFKRMTIRKSSDFDAIEAGGGFESKVKQENTGDVQGENIVEEEGENENDDKNKDDETPKEEKPKGKTFSGFVAICGLVLIVLIFVLIAIFVLKKRFALYSKIGHGILAITRGNTSTPNVNPNMQPLNNPNVQQFNNTFTA